MARYFDTSESEHLKYLPEEYRDHPRIATLAGEVEDDIRDYFTGQLPAEYYALDADGLPYGGTKLDDYRYVYLRGFRTDATPTDATETALQTAMIRAVAEVLVWRLRQENRDPAVQSKSNTKGNTTLRPGADKPWPRGWKRRFKPFDTRPRGYVV